MTCCIDESFRINGEELGFDHAEAIKEQGYGRIDNHKDGAVVIDLGGLTRANSVTVVIMLAWFRRGQAQDKRVSFTNLSDELKHIIEFSGLGKLFGSAVVGE